MSWWEAVIMGTLQGLTEFLPVSSSGHIEIVRQVLGIEVVDNMQFTMLLHAGTVLSTIVVFGREIGRLLGDLFKFRLNEGTLFVINLVVASLPVAFVGLMFREQVESLFSGNLLLVGIMLMVTAGLLWWSGRVSARRAETSGCGTASSSNGCSAGVATDSSMNGLIGAKITPVRAFVIGIAQAVAVLPGLSRSGSTISAGLLQGIDRGTVAKFSFLMALIPILGELLLDASELDGKISGTMMIGFLAAFVTGCLACRWMVRLVTGGRLVWFALYCAVAGIIAVAFSI